jgi:hypothetical protein
MVEFYIYASVVATWRAARADYSTGFTGSGVLPAAADGRVFGSTR